MLTTTPKKDVSKNFRNLTVKTLLRGINSDMKKIGITKCYLDRLPKYHNVVFYPLLMIF